MKTIRLLAAGAALLFAAAAVPAQPAAGAGSGPAASAPRAGPGGPGRMGGRWGSDVTPGWALMSPAERQEHQERMRSMTSREACQAYMEQHHARMLARARETGRTLPAGPRRDACAGLQR